MAIALRINMFKRQRRRRNARGLSLIEILIVVTIISLIAGGITVHVMGQGDKAKVTTAQSEAATIQSQVEAWMMLEGKRGCPTVQQLIDEEFMKRTTRTWDPWKNPYRIRCLERHVVVLSNGRDRMAETDDDIRVPPKEAG